MSQVIRGIIRGKTIELNEDPGLEEGGKVEVLVRPIRSGQKWGEGILRSAGGWADYPEMDAVMERIRQDRKRERRSVVEE
jgi:hypothetical protein